MFEFCDTDLKKYMDLTGRGPANPLPHKVVQSFMYQLCKGLAHLHSHGVISAEGSKTRVRGDWQQPRKA